MGEGHLHTAWVWIKVVLVLIGMLWLLRVVVPYFEGQTKWLGQVPNGQELQLIPDKFWQTPDRIVEISSPIWSAPRTFLTRFMRDLNKSNMLGTFTSDLNVTETNSLGRGDFSLVIAGSPAIQEAPQEQLFLARLFPAFYTFLVRGTVDPQDVREVNVGSENGVHHRMFLEVIDEIRAQALQSGGKTVPPLKLNFETNQDQVVAWYEDGQLDGVFRIINHPDPFIARLCRNTHSRMVGLRRSDRDQGVESLTIRKPDAIAVDLLAERWYPGLTVLDQVQKYCLTYTGDYILICNSSSNLEVVEHVVRTALRNFNAYYHEFDFFRKNHDQQGYISTSVADLRTHPKAKQIYLEEGLYIRK